MKQSDWRPLNLMNDRTIADLKREIILRSAGKVEQPAEMLLILFSHILGREKTWLLAHPDQPIAENSQHALEIAWSRLSEGEPLAYITGIQAFFGLDFIVTPHVLIPRPETELLIEAAIGWLSGHPNARKAIDIGSGSGCIAVSIAKTFKDLQFLATDISPQALHVAHQNALRHSVDKQIRFLATDLLEGISETFDLVCANLPYIPSGKLSEINSIVFEPGLALDGGNTGLDFISRLLEQLPTKLNTPGCCLLEIEETLGREILTLARNNFPHDQVSLKQDLAGKDRLLVIIRD
jgi:release factor glutamine methyltransferase